MQEAAPPVGIHMQPEQEFYLKNFIDPEIDRLIANMELERVRRQLSDEYQKRTIHTI